MSTQNMTHTEQLVFNFFRDAKLEANELEISYSVAAQADGLLPFVVIALHSALQGTSLEGQLLTFRLRKNDNALCHLEVVNLEMPRPQLLLALAEQFPARKEYDQVFQFKLSSTVGIGNMLSYFERALSSLEHGNYVSVEGFTSKVYQKLSSFSFSEILINRARKNANQPTTVKKSNSDELIKQALERRAEFDLSDCYKTISVEQKALLEELSLMATGSWLVNNPSKNLAETSKPKLPEVGSLLLLAAMLRSPLTRDRLAKQRGCPLYKLKLPESLTELLAQMETVVSTRTFSVNDSTTSWFVHARSFVESLNLSEPVTQLLADSFDGEQLQPDRLVTQLLALDCKTINHFKALNPTDQRLLADVRLSGQIKQRLSETLIGQAGAVNDVVKGYLQSSISQHQGPRLIYTFAGPSGVGKTFLASQLAKVLNEFEQSGYQICEFNMEQFLDERDAMRLFGSGVQYTDAALGVLTTAVRLNPRRVVILDEIEKAHHSVIQSLLALLDSGIGVDQTSQEKVDFSQCIFIITTNLGQDLLADNAQGHALDVLDVLQTAKRPDGKPGLSPEFINRLGKGYSVLFKELQTNHFVRLAERQLQQAAAEQGEFQFCWSPQFAAFLLQSLAPGLSARRLKTALPKFQADILEQALPHLQLDAPATQFDIEVDYPQSDDAEAYQLLMCDDDKRVFDQVASLAKRHSLAICPHFDELEKQLMEVRPDALLVDIETVADNPVLRQQRLQQLHSLNPSLPLFTYRFSENGGDDALSYCHEVREHFNIRLNQVSDDYQAMVQRVKYYLQTERQLQSMTARNLRLRYQCQVSSEAQRLQVRFHGLTHEQILHTEDLEESTQFISELPEVTLNDVIGLNRAKTKLSQVIGWMRSPQKLSLYNIDIPSGFLFAGPPGTGKTLLARAVAGECGFPFFSVSAADLSSSKAGASAQNVQKLFAAAKKYAPSIVFIDEIDAIASARSSATDSAARDDNLTVNALLTAMDGFKSSANPVFVMAATNHPERLDAAVTRPGRFDDIIYCDLPNASARAVFFERFADKRKLQWSDEQVQSLVALTQGRSAAEIDRTLREAIYQAVSENQPLTHQHVKDAVIRVTYGAPSDAIRLGDDEKRRTAYHEAGHLLVSKLLMPETVIDYVTIEPRNQALGFVATRASEEYQSLSKASLNARLQVLLAGRAAERYLTGCDSQVSTGASNDIEKATRLAKHAIFEAGLSPELGPVNLPLLTRYEESELLIKGQQLVAEWLKQAQADVDQLLTQHSQLLDTLATTLVEQESMLGHELDDLFR